MKISSLTKNLSYNDEKVAITVLFETETTKEIRIAFKSGQMMKKHQTKFPITVEIFEGSIDFGVNEELIRLEKGDLVSLDANIPHDLLAIDNSIVRLTLAKADSVERVKQVEG